MVTVQGTGPWNLEIQVVGPKSSEIIQIPGINSSRTKLQVPIPDAIDKEGGSFDIELGQFLSRSTLSIFSLLIFGQ
jgi:nucleoporin POM152